MHYDKNEANRVWQIMQVRSRLRTLDIFTKLAFNDGCRVIDDLLEYVDYLETQLNKEKENEDDRL